MADTRSDSPLNLSRGGRFVIITLLVLFALFYLTPLYVMLVNSLKPLEEIRAGGMMNLPGKWTLQPWLDAWSKAQIAVNPGTIHAHDEADGNCPLLTPTVRRSLYRVNQ